MGDLGFTMILAVVITAMLYPLIHNAIENWQELVSTWN